MDKDSLGPHEKEVFAADRVMVVAEIGGNHEGSFKNAKDMLHLAADSGATAVKFQVYEADSLVNRHLSMDRHNHFKKFELGIDRYVELAELAKRLGVTFMASVWNKESLKVLSPYITIHKVGSGDLTAFELIEEMAKTGKPILLSCGLATIEDINQTLSFIYSIDQSYEKMKKICLLQCTVMYPIPDSDANLNSMLFLSEQTGLPVGYSDHTIGSLACEVAVSMGARAIEKHFTDGREGKTFRDHRVSVTRNEMRALVSKIKRIRKMQGTYDKKIMPSEMESGHLISFRRAVYPRVDLPAGSVLDKGNMVSLRPNVGIDSRDFFTLIGKRLKVAKKAYEPFHWSELEGRSNT